MRERPILFSGPMVCAILEGRKTMTRRVIKPQPSSGFRWGFEGWEDGHGCKITCPYGEPGDRLWVRETFAEELGGPTFGFYVYRADSETVTCESVTGTHTYRPKWKPSIYMPRKASRLVLEIVSVRGEHLQEISEADAEREGVEKEFECNDFASFMNKTFDPRKNESYKLGFKHLWDKINKGRGYGWDCNPLVWVIELNRINP